MQVEFWEQAVMYIDVSLSLLRIDDSSTIFWYIQVPASRYLSAHPDRRCRAHQAVETHACQMQEASGQVLACIMGPLLDTLAQSHQPFSYDNIMHKLSNLSVM